MDNNTLLFIMMALFLLSVIIILIIVLNNAKKTNDLHNELSRSIYEIRTNLNKDLLDMNRSFNMEFNNFSERINSNLIQGNKSNSEIYNRINERIVKIDEAQKGINELSKDVVSLQNILIDKKSRGTFGEVELYSLLEAAYGNDSIFYEKQLKLPNGSVADAVLYGSESMPLICIDSKFPLENYRRIYDDSLTEKEKEGARKQFRDDVKKHLDDISKKYIIEGVTADMAYMFIPAEAIFSEIYANFTQLVDYSYQQKVYIVSPTTLMAYITAIKSIYLSQKKDEQAKEIEKLLADLSIEFKRYELRTQELLKQYENLGNAFINLNTTSSKIIKKFSRINSGDIDDMQ